MKKSHFFAGLALTNKGLSFTPSLQHGARIEDFTNRYDVFNDFSIEVRIKPVASGNDYQFIAGQATSGQAHYSIFIKSGILAFDSYTYNSQGGLIYEQFPVAVPNDVFVTVRIALKDGLLKGYLNGVEQFSRAAPYTISPSTRNAFFRLGSARLQYYFGGIIDYCRVISAGVTIADISLNQADGNSLIESVKNAPVLYEYQANGPTTPPELVTL